MEKKSKNTLFLLILMLCLVFPAYAKENSAFIELKGDGVVEVSENLASANIVSVRSSDFSADYEVIRKVEGFGGALRIWVRLGDENDIHGYGTIVLNDKKIFGRIQFKDRIYRLNGDLWEYKIPEPVLEPNYKYDLGLKYYSHLRYYSHGFVSYDVPLENNTLQSIGIPDDWEPSDIAIVDMVAFYSNELSDAIGDVGAISQILAEVDWANMAFLNSKTGVYLRVVDIRKINVGNYIGSSDIAQLIMAKLGWFDGMEYLLRHEGIDVLAIFTYDYPSGYCGYGGPWWRGTSDLTDRYYLAVVSLMCDYTTLAHEVGHDFGCDHDPVNHGQGGKYPFNYAYIGDGYGTIMAYTWPIVPYFSDNAVVQYNGKSIRIGTEGARNAEVIRLERWNVVKARNSDRPDTGIPVYSFSRIDNGGNFFTAWRQERNFVRDILGWHLNGIGFIAPTFVDSKAVPVYRFWSPISDSHIYTIQESEKRFLIDEDWIYEGVAFYAYPPQQNIPGTCIVYRLWDPRTHRHYFAVSEHERDIKISEGFVYELEAFRVIL